jgi:hypothetical protein
VSSVFLRLRLKVRLFESAPEGALERAIETR